MIYARLQRNGSYLCSSLSVIASLCAAFWPMTLSVSRAYVEGESGVYQVMMGPMFSQAQKLIASDGGADDFFGTSLAMSGDTIVVGAPLESAAYVFVRPGAVWTQQQKLTGGAAFGLSVEISGDTIVVGAPREELDTGAAYVFVRADGVWSEQQRLIASNRAEQDNFGTSVGISGDTIVVGARFNRTGPNPQQGAAYVFVRSAGVWTEQQLLTADDGGAAEFFGDAVAISGNSIVVGAARIDEDVIEELGLAYVFVRTAGVWNEQQRLTSNAPVRGLFGGSVAINGDTIVVGAIFESAAYVFERAAGVWSQPQRLTGGFEFGISASIGGDTIVVGARNERVGDNLAQGAAYVFVRDAGMWSEHQRLIASDGARSDQFGNSVSISGNIIVVAAPFDQVDKNQSQGSAYIFTPNNLPVITTSPVTLQQGRTLGNARIATVSDNESPASALAISVVSGGSASGITLSNIANTDGSITADLSADCAATSGTVRLRVTDTGGLSTEADLQVMVTANDPPVITCPANLAARTETPGSAMMMVSYPAPVATDDCGVASVVCNPPSGSSFPLGTTTVTCTVTDTSSNTSQCSFTVTLFDACVQDDSNPGSALLFISTGPQSGEYQFCCGGAVISGKGWVIRKGNILTLTHNGTSRRVQASVDSIIGRGSASLQSPPGAMRCSITDRNIRNNICQCGGG